MVEETPEQRIWLFLEKPDEARISQGIDGYRDKTGEVYQYDSLVPNYRQLSEGDLIVLRRDKEILGTGSILKIIEEVENKIHRRCPDCNTTDIRERATKIPRYKCGKCAIEFSQPSETVTEVKSFSAIISNFTKLLSAPSVQEVKSCAASGNGEKSQLSILLLDGAKARSLFEWETKPTSQSSATKSSGGGQGFGLTQADRNLVEARAMTVVSETYEAQGWLLLDTSLTRPYDFWAQRGDEERFIEVKGTTGKGRSVILTHGEVKYARNNQGKSALVVVSEIELVREAGVKSALGGRITTLADPWIINEANLNATQYRYDV